MGTSRTKTVLIIAAIAVVTAVAVFISAKTGHRTLTLLLAAVGVIGAVVYIIIANKNARSSY